MTLRTPTRPLSNQEGALLGIVGTDASADPNRTGRSRLATIVALAIWAAAYAAAGLLVGDRHPAHVHSLLDLIRLIGWWSVLALPALVAVRVVLVASALDVAGALTGWGVSFVPRVRAALLAEVVFAAATFASALMLVRGREGDAPPFSFGALLSTSNGVFERLAFEREWLHALPQMVGFDDGLFVVALGIAWSYFEHRPAPGAVGRAMVAYACALAIALGVITLLTL